YLPNKDDAIYVNGERIKTFPYLNTNGIHTVLDHRKIGYYIPGDQPAIAYKQTQFSRDQKDLRHTQGDFTGLYLPHGHAPADKGYTYAMLIDTDKDKLNKFAEDMAGQRAPYTILRKDSIVHSVKYHPENLTGLSIFHPTNNLDDKY